MDVILIIIVISIIAVGLFFKDFKSVVYFIGILDIIFRLFHKFSSLIKVKEITNFVNTYIPNSIESIINNYSSGILNIILIWILFFIYVYFVYYLIKYWIKKKK